MCLKRFAKIPCAFLEWPGFMRNSPHLDSVYPRYLRVMSEISRSGELKTLSPERIWQEFQKSLASPSPDKFILTLEKCGASKALLPEMNIALQTLNSLSYASTLTKETNIRYAALMNDIGKKSFR